MPLSDCFDAVVMLTLSDWKTEPRSNRFHYATRFARDLPVLFVQPIAARGSSLRLEATEYPGLELVYVPRWPEELEAEDLPALLRSRRIRRPLLWIYSALRYQRVVDSLPRGFRVYHATEDYFKRSTRGYGGDDELERSLVRMLRDTNLLVAVTDGVLLSYREQGGYRGPSMVLENGCDAQFLLYLADRHAAEQPLSSGLARPAAIYQGGINARVDFALLSALTVALPDWDFWFCGRADDRLPDWTALKSRPNVRYFGELGAEALGRLMCQATVGLVPFHQDDVIRVSLPLKAYEYVSCGLPVVSVPIDALRRDVDLFTLAADAEGFADAILAAARTRHSPAHLSRRREAARRNSYDERYRELRERLITEQRSAAGKGSTLNVALLYDDRSMHVNTIREHAEAFKKYSRHAIHFVPVTGPCDIAATELQRDIDLSLFDVLILHHSVRISLADHLCEAFARQIERHMGLKILFIQDEYDSTETARR
ncbi:MAG TPA: glycosyltransferase, partial [Burkholderiales bacterium]|nr:glycosyltransferase [Burkholderiales bacterium]